MAIVAISKDFLTAFSKIPKQQQKKINEFLTKFMSNPFHQSLNYESIKEFKDKNLKTVRIDLCYRAIVYHPPKEDTFLLVWVDHHDEAIRWGRNKICDINKKTGALQVYNSNVVNEIAMDINRDYPKGLFKKIDNEIFELIGIPSVFLPSIRKIDNENQLWQLQEYLPEEAYEGLIGLASGMTPEEVIEDLCKDSNEDNVEKEYYNALKHFDSQRRFKVITSSEELSDILNKPIDFWRVFLHPNQRKFIQGEKNYNYNGSVRITGGAGTGKTVVALHRAKLLSSQVYTDRRDKILFTTFSKSLADAIHLNLVSMCTEEEIKKIEVIHLHAWVSKFLKTINVHYNIASDREIDNFWSEAINKTYGKFPVSFYRVEWERIIKENDISKIEEYLQIARIGRGVPLKKEQRVEVWKTFDIFESILKKHNKREWIDVIKETRKYLKHYRDLLNYKAVIVDEAQDFNTDEFKLIREIVPEDRNDLFIVGDTHQRIYNRKVVFKKCGINIIGKRSKALRVNYRTTEEIRKEAMQILKGLEFDNFDGNIMEQKGDLSVIKGQKPIIKEFGTYFDEVEFITGQIKKCMERGIKGSEICIAARTKKLISDIYVPALQYSKIPFILLDKVKGNANINSIRLSSMHRVKGLEFKVMFIVSANEGVIPYQDIYKDEIDVFVREEYILREKCLLYVVMTRARDQLYITGYKKLSNLIN